MPAIDEDDGRLRRIETRVTRMMMALGLDPGQGYNLAEQAPQVDLRHREIMLPHLNVTLLDCANAVASDGGDLRQGWTLVLRDRNVGTVTFAE